MILTMDDQRYLQISQRNNALANALNVFNVASADEDSTYEIMRDQLVSLESHIK